MHGNTSHGDSKSLLNGVWFSMKNRCFNKNTRSWKTYGQRGIKVCNEWLDYPTFKKWALESGYKKGLSIERIDVNGNYEPSNCTWIPKSEQAKNTTFNHKVTYKGETKNMSDWAKEYGIRTGTLWHRLKIGWSAEKALTTKLAPESGKYTKGHTYNGTHKQ